MGYIQIRKLDENSRMRMTRHTSKAVSLESMDVFGEKKVGVAPRVGCTTMTCAFSGFDS
jgi:hypothetical protein